MPPALSEEVLDALPMAVVLADPDGSICGWNDAAETLYGHARRDVLARPLVEVLFDTDDRRSAVALFDGVAVGRPWEGVCRVRRRDGALLVSSFRLVAVGSSGATAWIGTDGVDLGLAEQERAVLLSAEHAARATAEEALALVEAILTSAPVGIAVFDLALNYVRVNDAYAALSGMAAADHIGGLVGQVGLLQIDVVADLRRVVTTGRTVLGRHIELGERADPSENRHFTVSYFPVNTATGALVGAGLTLVEVTESRRAEAERAALLSQAETAQQRLSILATASTVLTTTMDLDELLARLARVLTPSAADWCIIELLGSRGQVEHVAVSHRDRGGAEELATFLRSTRLDPEVGGLFAAVIGTGQARLVSAGRLSEIIHPVAARRLGPPLRDVEIHSSVLVPIETRGQVLGVLLLATDRNRQLDHEDLDLAVEIAHSAALAVGNARAFQQEHQIAEALQRALLPAMVPSVPNLDVAVRYVAATDRASVGGDWYDVFAFDDGTTGVVVGDVVGHDIAASTSMGQLRSALRAYAYEDHESPASALSRVDRRFDSLGLTLATCVFGVVDIAGSTFRWSNAGHPPPLLVRDGQAAFLADGAGALLGVTAGADCPEAVTDLRAGDLLVLYTDGLVERRREPIDIGLTRLAGAAAAVAGDDAGATCDALLAAMLPPSATREDDIAILVARVQPETPAALIHRLPFESRPESVGVARGFTAGVLSGAGWADQVDTAVLLVSELVTNAIRHARGPCELTVTFLDDNVEVAVEDGDPRLPATRDIGPLEEHGRGYLLVAGLADDWGLRLLPNGKAAWFVLRARRA